MLKRNSNRNIIGIGITEGNLLNSEGHIDRIVADVCAKMSYSLYYWTIRDDDMTQIPFNCSSYIDVYRTLARLGVTGFIT